MKTKILQILPQEEYFSPTNGGAIATWVKECFYRNSKYEILICTPKADDYFNGFSLIKIPVKGFIKLGKKINGILGHHLKYNSYPILAAIIVKLKGIDIIHVHNRPTYIPIIKRINPKTKVILHMHNDHILGLNKKQIIELHKYSDKIISVSEYIQQGIIKKGLEYNVDLKSKCVILLNGSNPDHFIKQTPAQNYNLLFIGRLNESKGIKQLILATLKVIKKIPDVKLIIAGSAGFGKMKDTPFVRSLKKLTENYIQNFNFLGYVNHDEIPNLFNDIALYCIPSVWNDPCPLAVIEGMASGIPMVVSNKGGIPELVGDTAIKTNCENIDELANNILFALNNKKEISALAEKAYNRFINNFTWEHVQNNYYKIIEQL